MSRPKFKVGDRVVEQVAGPGSVIAYYGNRSGGHVYRVACDRSRTYTLDEDSLEPESAVIQLADVVRGGRHGERAS